MASAAGIRAGRAYIEVTLQDRIAAGARRIEQRMRSLASGMRALSRHMIVVGSLAAAAMAPAVSVYSQFEDRLSAIAAKTGAAGDELNRVREVAKQLGATTSFSAIQVAGAGEFLAQAGRTIDQIPTDLPVMLNIARAGGEEVTLPVAADIVTNVAGGFQIPDELTRVGDVMAQIAASANVSILQLGETFKFAAPAAAAAGQQIEEMAAAAGILGNSGVQATNAGTDLKNLLVVLARTADIAGVKTQNADGSIRDLLDVMSDLGAATAGLSEADRLSLFIEKFGKISAKSALILSGAGNEIERYRQVMQGAEGAAARMATTMDDNLGGSFRALKSAAEAVGIALGQSVSTRLRDIVDRLTAATSSVAMFIDSNRDLVQQAAMVAGGIGLTSGALMTLSLAATAAAFAFRPISMAAGLVLSLMTPIAVVTRGVFGLAGSLVGLRRGFAALKMPTMFITLSSALRSLPALALAAGSRVGSVLSTGLAVAGGAMAALGKISLGTAGALTGGLLSAVSRLTIAFGSNVAQLGMMAVGLAKLSIGGSGMALAKVGAASSGAISLLVRSMSPATSALMRMGTLTAIAGTGLFTLGHRALFASSALAKVSLRSLTSGLATASKGVAGSLLAITKATGAGLATGGIGLLKGLLLGLTSPAGLLTASIGGIGYALFRAAGGADGIRDKLSGLFSFGKGVFSGLAGSASQAWNSISSVGLSSWSRIVDRISSGDLQGAADVGMSALKSMWASTTAAFMPQWTAVTIALEDTWTATTSLLSDLWSGFGSMFPGVSKSLTSAWSSFYGFVTGNTGADDVELSWTDATFGLSAVFINLESTALSVWESIRKAAADAADSALSLWKRATGGISKVLVSIPGVAKLLGSDAESLRQEIDEQINRELDGINRKKSTRETESQKKQDAIETKRQQTLATLDEDRERKKASDKARIETATSEATAQADEAQRQLNVQLTGADIASTVAEIDRLQTRLDELREQPQTVALKIEEEKALDALHRAELALFELRGRKDALTEPESLVVDADISAAESRLAELQKQFDNLVTPDDLSDSASSAKRNQISQEITRQTETVEKLELLGVDEAQIDTAKSKLAELQQQLAAVHAESIAPESRDQFVELEAQIDATKAKLAELKGQKVDITSTVRTRAEQDADQTKLINDRIAANRNEMADMSAARQRIFAKARTGKRRQKAPDDDATDPVTGLSLAEVKHRSISASSRIERDQLAREKFRPRDESPVDKVTGRSVRQMQDELAAAQAADPFAGFRGAAFDQQALAAAGVPPVSELQKRVAAFRQVSANAGSAGTFSARAAGQMGAASGIDKLAEEVKKQTGFAEQTAANTEAIASNIGELSVEGE
tara:strand:- start:2563 stop:6642 length:4080 start_codon:yes stop_codon:yes gene_type:complete